MERILIYEEGLKIIMPENSSNLAPVDAAFKTLCRILFGRPVGGLLEFEPYLKEAMMPFMIVKSGSRGTDVFLSNPYYPKGAAFVSPDELAGIRQKPLSINDIKDIDSLFRAASENVAYCGNKVFGKNANVQLVDNAINCIDVYHSHNVRNVKRGAYLSYVRESEYVFGLPPFPKINYSIRCHEGINVNRMFETFYTTYSSDMYYSVNCTSCQEVMFGYNLRGKRHVVGNIELAPAKYGELKGKLTGEIADELARKKRVFSISDLARMGVKESDEGDALLIPTLPATPGVERAFSDTAKIVLGGGRGPIKEYVPWLQKRALPVKKVKGKLGSRTFKPMLPIVKDLPDSCLCTFEEAIKQNGPVIRHEDLQLDLRKLAAAVSKKAAFTLDFVDGACRDHVEVSQVIDSTEVYSSWDATSSQRSGCSSAIIQSKYIFGGYFRALDSEFCINCYDVVECRRCFELDSSSRCSDCYFSHNLEGCEECILCWNLKGKRYAVLNEELPKEEYLRIKRMLLDCVNAELDSKKKVERSVFALSQ